MCVARIRRSLLVIGGRSAQYVIIHSRMLFMPRHRKQHIDMGVEINHRIWGYALITTEVHMYPRTSGLCGSRDAPRIPKHFDFGRAGI